MKCLEKNFLLFIVPFVMSLALVFCSIGSLASTTNSGAITIQEQWADNVYNNFQSILQDSLKVSVPKSESDRIWNDYVDHCYSIWNLNEDDLQSHYGHFRDYVGSQFEMEKNPDNTYNYNMSYDAQTFIQDSFNTYLQSNPLSYKEAYIYSYNYLDVSVFRTYAMYQSTKELCSSNNPKWILLHYWYSSGQLDRIYFIALDTGYDYGLVGTVVGGAFNNVTLYKNWATLGRLDQIPNATKKTIMANGTVSDGLVSPTGNYPTLQTLANTSSQPASNTKTMLISSQPNNELVYVFSTLNAYKNYNSGMAQPYYMASGYTGFVVPNGYSVPNSNNSYESIVNNIQSGWTAQEVLALVDRIMNSGSGSGGSGSGDDDDGWLDLGIFGDIGKAIAKVIGAIITAIASIFEEIIGIVTQVSDTLLQGVIFEFLSAFIGWLPDEIIALLTALFSVAVLFALVKLIREAF